MTGNDTARDAYRESGVDIDLEAQAVKALVSQLTYRRSGEFSMATEIGHFAGDAGDDPDPVHPDDRNHGAETLFIIHGFSSFTVGGGCPAHPL